MVNKSPTNKPGKKAIVVSKNDLNVSSDNNIYKNLYNHQIIGCNWILNHLINHEGCILADDMGLGKTLQIITVILHLKTINEINKKQKVLIVLPLGLINNWMVEFKKHAPTINVLNYYDTREIKPDTEVVITTYNLIVFNFESFNKEWYLCILDEAQKIKNPETKLNKTMLSIKALHKIAMTGTPFENSLKDFYGIFNFINPGYLGNQTDFYKCFLEPIWKHDDKEGYEIVKPIVFPYILRRDKRILKNFPEKKIINIPCTFTKEQKTLYERLLSIPKHKHKTTKVDIYFSQPLKQLCNHPAQYTKDMTNPKIEESGKMIKLAHLLTTTLKNEKCIIVTQYISGDLLIKLFEKYLNKKILFLNGKCSAKERVQIVNDFQNPALKGQILIMSLKVGGVGLNLTAARHLIILDYWWNGAVERQAVDRIYRIGQLHDVTVYRFHTIWSVEEYFNDLIKKKHEIEKIILPNNNVFKFIKPLTKVQRDKLLNKQYDKWKGGCSI